MGKGGKQRSKKGGVRGVERVQRGLMQATHAVCSFKSTAWPPENVRLHSLISLLIDREIRPWVGHGAKF